MAEHTGSTPMFAIFMLSMYSLVLIPYTIYKACSCGEDEVVKPWQAKGKPEASKRSEQLKKVFSKGTLTIVVMWVFWFLLLWYIQLTVKDLKPFDPYEILGVERGASLQVIKKAYYNMSKIYHPDKNPDPKAAAYFAEYIIKAYSALTDDASRENWEKFGHPDGNQGMGLGVALPEWLLTMDRKTAPFLLLGLVFFGVLLPLGVMSWYMLRTKKYTGPNGISQETLLNYWRSKHNVKESQSLVRIPETLVVAEEFINLPTPSDHTEPLAELRKAVLRKHPDLKDKKAFWQRVGGVVKAHMLVLAHLERLDEEVPPALQVDLKFVLQKTPGLLEEIVRIACYPRPPHGYGWLTPALAAVEMMQCVAQAVSIAARKSQGKGTDNQGALLQLPHFDEDAIKKLKRRKINSLRELQEKSEEESRTLLQEVGFSEEEVDEVLTFLSAVPTLYVKATCEVDGEQEIMEQDPVRCQVQVILTRPSHKALGGFLPKGSAVRAYTPHYPFPRDESWFLMLTDPKNNAVMAYNKTTLLEAEQVGFDDPESGPRLMGENPPVKGDGKARPLAEAAEQFMKERARGSGRGTEGPLMANGSVENKAKTSSSKPTGQVVEFHFLAPKAGNYTLDLQCMSDCYIGCDVTVPVRFKVVPQTRAAAEGRDERSKAKAREWDSEEEDQAEGKEVEDGSEEEEEDQEEEDEDIDTDYENETGTDESDEEDDDDRGANSGEEDSEKSTTTKEKTL